MLAMRGPLASVLPQGSRIWRPLASFVQFDWGRLVGAGGPWNVPNGRGFSRRGRVWVRTVGARCGACVRVRVSPRLVLVRGRVDGGVCTRGHGACLVCAPVRVQAGGALAARLFRVCLGMRVWPCTAMRLGACERLAKDACLEVHWPTGRVRRGL